MTVPAIKVDEISYYYGDIKAVDGISFEVAQGEILGFLGPNGAGKSTTIKMLTGQLSPKTGKASILAALYPAAVKYLYFVSRNDGTHHFSKTLSEHNRAVYKYQKRKKFRGRR